MRHVLSVFILVGTLAMILAVNSAFAQTRDVDSEKFKQITDMDMQELTDTAKKLLNRQYPEEDWESYNFPEYIYSNQSIEYGYKIAVKESELLGQLKCYCFCEAVGHQSLLDCFFEKGDLEKGFDDHASNCNICYLQSLRAFVYHKEGFSIETIQKGFEKIYNAS